MAVGRACAQLVQCDRAVAARPVDDENRRLHETVRLHDALYFAGSAVARAGRGIRYDEGDWARGLPRFLSEGGGRVYAGATSKRC